MEKTHLSKDLKEVREQTTWISGRRVLSHSNMCKHATVGICPVVLRIGMASVAGTHDGRGRRLGGQEAVVGADHVRPLGGNENMSH